MAGPNLFTPPLSRQGKTFHTVPFKGWKVVVPPSVWLKLQNTGVKTTSKSIVSLIQHGLNFLCPPPFLVGVKPHSTLLPLYCPPPPHLLPIINDHSLISIDFERLAKLIRALSPSLSDHIQLFIHDTVNCRKFIISMIGCGCQGVKSDFSFEKKIVLSSGAVFRKK